jgi:uncharacterized membrane protein
MPSPEPSLHEWLRKLEATPANRIIAAVGYIPFLCFLPIFARQDDDFALFHGRQSLVLLAALVGLWVLIWLVDLLLGGILGHVLLIGPLFKFLAWIVHYVFGGMVSLAYLVAIIAGAIQAMGGREWRIPLVSSFAEQLRL